MAKFKKIFTATTETSILEFRGDLFKNTMTFNDEECCFMSDKPSLCNQVANLYSEDDEVEDIEGLVEAIEYEFDDVPTLIEQLEEYEYGY